MRIYEPAARPGILPGVFFIHGGGFVRGHVEWFNPFCEDMVLSDEVVVASVEYRLAPEHPFSGRARGLLCRALLVRG